MRKRLKLGMKREIFLSRDLKKVKKEGFEGLKIVCFRKSMW